MAGTKVNYQTRGVATIWPNESETGVAGIKSLDSSRFAHTRAIGSMPAETTATAVFCQNFNDLFDCFNSLSTSGKVHLRTAISNTSCHMRKLNALADWLKTVKIPDPKTGNDMSKKFRCFSGWLQAIQALQKLWAVVNLHEGARFLLTRRLNQDTLEHFFSIIRSRGGYRDNPTPYEFLHAFKQASVNHLLLPKAKAKAYNTCRVPQAANRYLRGAGHVTGQASVGRRP